MRYGPSFDLDISAGLRKDHNTPEYLHEIVKKVGGLLEMGTVKHVSARFYF